MKILWQNRLQNRLRDIGENILIKGDRAFYVGDNDEQKQMKLRKFSLESGEQLAGAPFRDFTRAATFDDDGRTLVVLGLIDTIYKFNAADLALISKHKKGVLKYGNFIALSSKGGDKKAITATDDTLFIYDFETQTGTRKRLKGCAAIFKQDELNFLIFTRSGQIYGLNLSGCELKIIAKTCPMTQAQRAEGGYCIRVGEAGENEGANELVFTDANFNVKFRVKLDFDFDKFELAADGSDGWRGYFINEPNELKVLDLRSETGGFKHGSLGDLGSGEHDGLGKFAHDKAEEFRCDEADEFNCSGSDKFTRNETSKSGCEATDKFEYDDPFKFKLGEQVQYLAAKPVLAYKFKQKGARILGVVTAASCRAASAKYEAEQKDAFAEQNLMPEGDRGIENLEYSLLAPGKNEKRRHRAPECARDLVLVDNAYDEDAEQILTCYEI
ncbi:hypothetical protein [uncultured Campylobacter sp.]|uniref:hypothetical protein n=1 Tax=uncultured Campylobacter sp. TaxID=218934 RepID=UPI002614CCA1|nr:hypothetical protein [uncultured Campylobacter sp.]